jgi:hypothetical protein
MAKDADLEIGLRWRWQDKAFDVSLAYDQPLNAEDRRLLSDEPLSIDVDQLRKLLADEESYASHLSDAVFGSDAISDFYKAARQDAERDDLLLHLRLLIDPSAPPEYHAIRWESLRDPIDKTRIATRHSVLLSRYLSTATWVRLAPKPRHQAKGLVVIAAPSDITDYQRGGAPLHEVRRSDERDRVQRAFQGLNCDELAEPGAATLERIIDGLNKSIDVLYLVCHGALNGSRPLLYLEKADGTTHCVEGERFIERIRALRHRPTLAVLCSCYSAGSATGVRDDGGGLAALGPQLAGAGVAAVVAMNGPITVESADLFFPRFIEEFKDDGAVDRAMATARGAISDRRDWWAPVLFSRLRSGRTWYEPGFPRADVTTWTTLIAQIQSEMCTPVVGPGLADPILGSRKEIARRWVERWQMPIAPHNLEDLAKVAQYLGVSVAPEMRGNELLTYLKSELKARYADQFSSDEALSSDVEGLLSAVGREMRKNPTDPYRVVAGIPSPVFVTTSWSSLLADALEDAGKKPRTASFDWNDLGREPLDDEFVDPTPEEPLVYHLFGTLEDTQSLVLSEDDYFSWMTAWVGRRTSVPKGVGTALTRRSLLFLGHQLDDWDFRFLFQGIKTFGGSGQLRRNYHVGVQLNPEIQTTEPEAAQTYIETLFDEDRVSIYWGTVETFVEELQRHLEDAS